MQNSVAKGTGGMLAVLGLNIENLKKIINENNHQSEVFIANDNSDGQIVVSGKINDLKKFAEKLKSMNIKNIMLPVSAPFHCNLMNNASKIMKNEIEKLNLTKPKISLISNVTANKMNEIKEIKGLLIKQIEHPVRWRESVLFMIRNGTDQFIEIGPGKVLSGLIKRIDRKIQINNINTEEDINSIKLNE